MPFTSVEKAFCVLGYMLEHSQCQKKRWTKFAKKIVNSPKKSITRTSFETQIPATTVWLCYMEMITNKTIQTGTRIDFFGLFTVFWRILSTVSSDIDFRPEPFSLRKQPSFLNFLSISKFAFCRALFQMQFFQIAEQRSAGE